MSLVTVRGYLSNISSYRRAGLLLTAVCAVLVLALVPSLVAAENYQDLSGQLGEQNRKAAETDEHLSDVNQQLASVRAQISDTQDKIAATNAGIADAKAHMAANQDKLGELMRKQYTESNQTKLEQLVGSKSFSQFVSREQYIQAGQDRIAEVVQEVIKTKKELEAKGAELAKLNQTLAQAQNGLVFAQAQAQNELAQIDAAKSVIKEKLKRYQGGRVVNVGDHVNTGDLIGFQGNTGYSTGTHLHFEVQQNGNPVNPRNYTPSRFRWPLDGGFTTNQEFGPPNWAAAYSFHTGIDLGQFYGAPVYAAASGTVIYSGFDNSGFGQHVQIDHGGGLSTLYGHLAQ